MGCPVLKAAKSQLGVSIKAGLSFVYDYILWLLLVLDCISIMRSFGTLDEEPEDVSGPVVDQPLRFRRTRKASPWL